MAHAPIKGTQLVLLTVAVSLGIFMNVLDTSIANVAIPTIAGNMGVSADQGTWVITSFTATLAIVLPLTGWLSKRFGEVKLFAISTFLFTIASVLCALSTSLPMLILFRVLQGAVAGPMIPLSQSILLANYPHERKGLATALWATVAVAAPVVGPILGGWLTDNYTWPWIFYINVPFGLFSAYFTWALLKDRETEIHKFPVDFVGLILLAIGVACLQVLLDKGNDLDWFNSDIIRSLGVVSTISLSFFVAWELTDKNPIVDLTLFARRNFTVGTICISLGYMAYFGGVVILPLWLQTQMGYTPTWAGVATAPVGVIPLLFSPFMALIMKRMDLRIIVSSGFLIFATASFWSANFNTDVSFAHIALTRLALGAALPFFFIPSITISLSNLAPRQIASAAGLSNFCRILAGSFGTSIFVSMWDHRERAHQSKLAESVMTYTPQVHQVLHQLQHIGFSSEQSTGVLQGVVINQSYMLSTNDIFWISGVLFIGLMLTVWIAKPPFFSNAPIAMD
jgi:DHA2 family multidrug resistance protein